MRVVLCLLVLVAIGIFSVVIYGQNQAPKKRHAEAAVIWSGNDIFKMCQKYDRDDATPDTVGCMMFILGASQTLLMNDDTETAMKSPCPGQGVTNQQVGEVVIKWLNDHPEKRQLPAPFIVMTALNEAFPCRQ